MAEEAKWQRFSQRAGWFLDKITGSQWAQQTQQTQQQTSGQQSTGGIFLPWISNNQNLINSNKVSMNNWFTQWIQDWTIKSNIVLPWITNKPNEATLDTTTMKQKRQSYIYAKNNNINTKSINEQIEEERTWSNKVLGQTGKILKTYREAPINNFKKRWMRAIADSWLPWYFVDKTLEKAWAPDGLGDSIKDAVNETARKVALTYQNKVNEDFQKKVDKNIDAKIREKYDNESITDLIWKWDGAWARYKIWKWTVENWNMIPEIWLMFVNPYVWLATMWTDVYIQENQWTFEDMLQNWATYEQARNGAVAVWILNAWIELFMERFLWWAKWAWATALRRLFLKNAQREVVKQATKKWMAEIFARWVWERLKGSMVEWFEEVLQQITGNIMVKLINPDRDILDWARESFEWWFYNLFNWIWWATNIINEFKQNEQIQRSADIEALKYVAEWEQRKAQRMAREKARARFLERVKNPTMDNGYTPTPEQAQQRAREKEENEQFEDELRAKQNRENSRYQETEWENSWLSNSNDYSTDTTISKDYSHSDMVNTDSFFKTDENWQYIDFNWWKLYAWEAVSDTESQWLKWKYNKSMFSWVESFSRNPIYEEYRQNFYDFLKSLSNRITKKTEKEVKLWKTKTWADMKLTRKQLRHIIKLHGAFSLNDFLETINNPTYSRLQKWGNIYSDWPFYIKQRPNSDKFYYLWFKKNTDWSYNINTFYEITKSDAEWLLNRKLQNSDYQKYQLKYEEEWYTPWVARKDEKNISWKSGKMLKDFLKWQTIEELAKKYWVERIDVVKWLVDGMAYGSYSNKILRLAEEIKESTAPHELLHLVFDMVDPETKTYLISQVMQSEWWSAEKAEEWLADSFSNFYRTGKIESAPKSTWGKIKIFFKRVRSFINGMWKWRNQLEQMFTDIIESSGIEELQGKIDSNKEINESKAKMRKRFLEYRRNAEKTQIKTNDNNEKYQTVYHWSPYDFDKFDSANMWKWEWAQAHGWGHYVAINEDTWRRYAQMWWEPWTAWKWLSTEQLAEKYLRNNSTIEEDMAGKVASMIDYNKWDFEKWLKDVLDEKNRLLDYYNNMPSEEKKRWSEENLKKRIEITQEEIKALKKLNKSDFEFKTNRNLYEVEIPDPIKKDTPTGSNYFEEDSFVENNAVDRIVKAVKDSWLEVWKREWNWKWIDKMVDSYNTEKGIHAKNMYHILKVVLWWDKQASKFLESLWYDWIHYFWGRDGEAYVIFNDDALEIKNHEKYQKTEDNDGRKLSEWQIEYFKDSKVRDKDGKLLVVYHWTHWDFTIFDRKKIWSKTNNKWIFWEWFYFTSNKKYWDYYAQPQRSKEYQALEWKTKEDIEKMRWKTMKWYLNITNPFYWRSIKTPNAVKKLIETLWLKKNDLERNSTLNNQMRPITDEKKVIRFRNALEKAWYDWIIYEYDGADKDGNKQDEIVAFYSNQFKNIDNLNPTDNDDIRYQRVYHWSPAEFDRFDSSHMWEWEWAQAHGWGHYVAVEERTWRHYADMRHYDNEVEIQWRTITNPEDLWDVSYFVRELYRDIFRKFSMSYDEFTQEALDEVIDRKRTDYNNVIEYMQNLIDNPEKPIVKDVNMDSITEERKAQLEWYKDALEKLEELSIEDIKVRPTSIKRNFYEVEIPDPVKADTPTWKNYLEEDEALTDKEIKKFWNTLKRMWLRAYVSMFDDFWTKMLDYNKKQKTLLWFLERASWGKKMASKILEEMWYDGIHYFWERDGEAYVVFNDDDLEIKNHEKYQKVEYEYDENGKPKWIKFEEDNGEFDPSIFWEPSREEQIADDKENEKNNPFYNAWIKYNNQNYKDDQLTFEEFIQWISERWDKEQAEYNKKLNDISEAQNDPQLLDLQLRAVKLMEEEWNVGKKFWKNVSKEVRDRQQKEVESKREQLISDIVDYMYPWLKTEEITYDMQKEADQKEAEREMLGREELEEKLKYFKKDKNWNREAKDVKIENPQIKLDKILSAGKFEEIFTPLDRVIEWKTPQWQHWVIDNQKNPKQYKSVMEKINAGKTKTKVTLKDVTRDYRALEKYKADQEAEKAKKKKERDEAYAKKKQEEYKKIVRMKAFQRLVDMQRFEKYPFLTEEEIKNRYGFTDEEWKKITEQEEIKLPKKRWEKAISDLNKAVDSQVKALIEWLSWQNNLKRKDAEKNLWEIWEIDVDILLGRDEEKWQREVEEFEKIAEEEKKKSKKEKNKRMKEAVEEVLNIDIDTKREQQEKEKIEKMLKKVKNDETWKSKLWRELKTAFSTVDHKIKNISKPIYQALMQYFQNTSILTNERLKEATPFINALKKIRKENPVRYMDIRVALANRNIGYANGLLQEYGVKVPTKLLDTIYDEAEDVGLNINYLWSYYPLKVRSPKSLLTEIMWMKEWDFASEIDKRIKEESEKNWWPLDESQISDIIAEVIAWEDKWPDVRLWNAHMKKRNEKIKRTPKMLEYCYDPATTLIGYIEWMTQSIERAKFLGKSASWQVRDLGTYVYKVKHDLTWEQQDELMYLLQAVFNDKQQWFLFNTWRDIATLTTLWSPTSTITQIWDLWFSIYENWLGNTWKALWNMWIKKWLFNLEDMWIVNRWEEFTNINEKKTRFQKWINLVFKITWFSKMDMFGKSMYIKSTRLKRQKRAKKWENWDPQLRKDIMKRTDDEYVTDKIISDIRHWIFSKEVSMIMFMKLSNFQPLTRAQMPEAYLNHPWYIRMLYQFKTFGLKQTNYIISECKEALKEAKNWTPQQKREAVWRIVSLVASLALMWLWADELKDLLMRRRNESMILRAIFWDGNIDDKFVDKFVDNLAKLSWLSRYAIMNIKNDPVGIITSLFTDMPWENVINYPYRDIKNWLNGKSSDQMTQLFPVVWKRYYWAIWWWHDKQMEKLDKENKKSTKKKSSWSTRKPLTR